MATLVEIKKKVPNKAFNARNPNWYMICLKESVTSLFNNAKTILLQLKSKGISMCILLLFFEGKSLSLLVIV